MARAERWGIAALISATVAISYFDRQTLPVAIQAIQHEIPISNTQFSQLQAAFLTAYAIMYAGGGKLVDLLGTRAGFLAIMLWWSLACASHGLAAGFGMLLASRFLLGMGEGGGFPAATKALAEWFHATERAMAMGLVDAGTAVGAVCALPAIAYIIAVLNWRWVFFLAGCIGLVWAAWWWKTYYVPAVPARERALEIVLFSIAFFGQQSWSTLVMTRPADLFPRSAVGSVAGLVGFGGAMGGVVFGLVVGYLLDHGFGYETVFAIVSTLHVLAFGAIAVTIPKVKLLVEEAK